MKQIKTLTINGNTYEIADPDAAHIADHTVGEDAWSGLHTADRLCPPIHETGSLVSCEPLAGYPLTVQTADDATEVHRTGKNLFDFKQGVSLISGLDKYGYELRLPPGTYTVSAKIHTTGDRYLYNRIRHADGITESIGGTITIQKYTPKTFTLAQDEQWIVYIGNSVKETEANRMFEEDFDVQIEPGSTDTPYEPYIGGAFVLGEAVPGLAGVNHIWADKGEITVTGRADPVAAMNKITNAIIALGGNV